jgi:hypothetical protein
VAITVFVVRQSRRQLEHSLRKSATKDHDSVAIALYSGKGGEGAGERVQAACPGQL